MYIFGLSAQPSGDRCPPLARRLAARRQLELLGAGRSPASLDLAGARTVWLNTY